MRSNDEIIRTIELKKFNNAIESLTVKIEEICDSLPVNFHYQYQFLYTYKKIKKDDLFQYKLTLNQIKLLQLEINKFDLIDIKEGHFDKFCKDNVIDF